MSEICPAAQTRGPSCGSHSWSFLMCGFGSPFSFAFPFYLITSAPTFIIQIKPSLFTNFAPMGPGFQQETGWDARWTWVVVVHWWLHGLLTPWCPGCARCAAMSERGSYGHTERLCLLKGSVDLVYFFKETMFCFINSLYGFFGFYFIDFSSYFYYLSPICFGICLFFFCRSLRYIIRSLIWDLSFFLIYALMAINFPLRTAFAVSHRFR
jgi:hypothetical protein